ncbi:MAG: hypothetical protein SAJ12_05630 [Jaaginema sp. PMC 1079.18]|nr:hypothetical protein [Jaaginema sp. PMC 1080.18]MEC4850472.1 hypothetical protein [Jaaginema sp. PMC 1079.18]
MVEYLRRKLIRIVYPRSRIVCQMAIAVYVTIFRETLWSFTNS